MLFRTLVATAVIAAFIPAPALAAGADVIGVKVQKEAAGTYSFVSATPPPPSTACFPAR
jgi:hypothetical protein